MKGIIIRYIAASQSEREITISKVDLESEIKLIIRSIFDDFNLDVTSYKINNTPQWVPDPEYTHSILQKLKNLHDNISKELDSLAFDTSLEFDTVEINHTHDPLFSFLLHHDGYHFRVEAWSNISNNYMWDEKIEWIE